MKDPLRQAPPGFPFPSLGADLRISTMFVPFLTEFPTGERGGEEKFPLLRLSYPPSGSEFPVLQFERLGAEAREVVEKLNPDILVVFAYGRIFGPRFLSLFRMGGINIHPSLLPRYRGSSPIISTILNAIQKGG